MLFIKLYKHNELIEEILFQLKETENTKIIFVFGEKYFGKRTLANKLYNHILDIKHYNVSLFKTVECEHIDEYIDINANPNVTNVFVIPFYKFKKTQYENLIEKLYINETDRCCFIIFMRPEKELIDINRCYDYCNNICFSYFAMYPDDNFRNSSRPLIVHTPRINEFMVCEGADKYGKDDEYSYNCICSHAYYSNILVPEIQTDEYIGSALVYAGVVINNARIGDVDIICTRILNRTLNYEKMLSNSLFWNVDSTCEIIDGWREFVLYKRYCQTFVDELNSLYLKIYKYIYVDYNKYLDLSCLKQQKELWLNTGYSLLYARLYDAANYRLKHCDVDEPVYKCKLIPLENRIKVAAIVSEFDGVDIVTLLKITIEFFEETYDFNLIINALENIKRYDIECVQPDSLRLVNLALRLVNQWKDLTILKFVVKLFVVMFNTDKKLVKKIIDFYKTINGISIRTMEKIFVENEGSDLMNKIKNKMTRSKIFISFCRVDDSIAELVYDGLYESLSANYEILKYDHNVEYMDSLKDFMNQIENCECVVMIVSDAYLKSEGCMYEVLETMIGHNYTDKMLPIFISREDSKFYEDKKKVVPADIFGPVDNFIYSTYWADIKKEQQEKLKALVINNIDNLMNIEEAVNRLKKQDEIMKKINEFISVLKDRWQLSFTELYDNNFEAIINKIFKM